MTDVFQEIKQRLNAQDVARHYGFQPNRAGFICCPFHLEKTASLKLYPGTGGFYCFGCGAGGSVIEFTARLLGVDTLDAVRQLNAEFGLNIPLDCRPTKAVRQGARHRTAIAEAYKSFEAWRAAFIVKLCTAIRVGNTLKVTDLDKLTEREVLALRMRSTFEYWTDTLADGPPQDQAQIYNERGEITRWIDKVLNN